MTTSNCMTCIYGGSWYGEISTEPGHCYMFKDEPHGVCGQWRTSIAPPPAGERAELIADLRLNQEYYPKKVILFAADMLEADAQAMSNLLARIHRDGGHYESEHGQIKAVDDADLIVAKLNALSDAQQVAVPMTDAQIFACDPVPHVMFDQHRIDFARAIEAFHGIGAKP